MRVLVTGAEGQLVRCLLESGPRRGIEVIAAGRPQIDLARREPLLPVFAAAKADAIINAAAYTAVDQAETEPALAQAVNADGAGAVAQAARDLAIPLIHVSTDYVFDGSLNRPYREDDAVAPLGVYGATKLGGERAVQAAGSDHAILRTAWVYSPFGKNFVRTMLRLAETRGEISVVADQIGSPTSALDLAEAALSVAANLRQAPHDDQLRGVFHFAGAGEASWAEFAAEIFAQSSKLGGPSARVIAIPAAHYPTPARRPANSRLDTARIRAIHGVTPLDWRVALRQCLHRLLVASKDSLS